MSEYERGNLIKKMVRDKPEEVVRSLLEEFFWLPALELNVSYVRRSDDTDGLDSTIEVFFSKDLDGWIEVVSNIDPNSDDLVLSHRFRETAVGGGMSHRVRNALLILALAIKLDNEDKPLK